MLLRSRGVGCRLGLLQRQLNAPWQFEEGDICNDKDGKQQKANLPCSHPSPHASCSDMRVTRC